MAAVAAPVSSSNGNSVSRFLLFRKKGKGMNCSTAELPTPTSSVWAAKMLQV